MKNIDVIE